MRGDFDKLDVIIHQAFSKLQLDRPWPMDFPLTVFSVIIFHWLVLFKSFWLLFWLKHHKIITLPIEEVFTCNIPYLGFHPELRKLPVAMDAGHVTR